MKERKDALTLGEAARALGVDPDTVRRWADAGKIEVFTTPGRHRRFPRAAVEALLPRPRRPVRGLGEPPDRVAAELRRRVRSDVAALSEQDWHARLDERSIEWFRDRGRRMVDLLLGSLGSPQRATRTRMGSEAEALGREYGHMSARRGLSIGETTSAFLFFRARSMAAVGAVARRRGLDAARTTALFEEADQMLDGVIVALVEGHREASTRGRR